MRNATSSKTKKLDLWGNRKTQKWFNTSVSAAYPFGNSFGER